MNYLTKFLLVNVLLLVGAISSCGFAQDNMPISEYAWKMKQKGLVNISDLDSDISVKLIYATEDNFVGVIMYTTLREAFLQNDAVDKLLNAQKNLKKIYPKYSLIVYDAARPQSIQMLMWEKVKNTPLKRYVSSPSRISMHTYGMAIDVSILDSNSVPLDMGTEVDHLGKEAEPKNEKEFLMSGVLTLDQISNRELLRKVMKDAGFKGISNEWWHFEASSRKEAERKFSPLMF